MVKQKQTVIADQYPVSKEITYNSQSPAKPKRSKLWYFLLIPLALVGIFFIVMIILLVSLFSANDGIVAGQGNVAIIPVKGIIVTDSAQSFFEDSGTVASSDVIADIEKAEQDQSIQAIIFEIDSPGGSGIASDEIASKIKSVNKTTVAWVRELGASGAYWIASATEHIVVHKMSFVGSIGVIASYLEFSGLMEKYGVGYQKLTAGKYKDMGTPFRKLTDEEKAIFESELDQVHLYFIEEVAKNRNMSIDKIQQLATGQVFIGAEAYKLGLVDQLGGRKEALQFVEQKLNITVAAVEYKKPLSFFNFLRTSTDRTAFYIGKGIGKSLITARVSNHLEITT